LLQTAGMRLIVRLAMATIVAAAFTIVATSIARADSKPPAPQTEETIEVKVTPEMIRHSRINNWIYFGGFVYSLGVLLLLLAIGRFRCVSSREKTSDSCSV